MSVLFWVTSCGSGAWYHIHFLASSLRAHWTQAPGSGSCTSGNRWASGCWAGRTLTIFIPHRELGYNLLLSGTDSVSLWPWIWLQHSGTAKWMKLARERQPNFILVLCTAPWLTTAMLAFAKICKKNPIIISYRFVIKMTEVNLSFQWQLGSRIDHVTKTH